MSNVQLYDQFDLKLQQQQKNRNNSMFSYFYAIFFIPFLPGRVKSDQTVESFVLYFVFFTGLSKLQYQLRQLTDTNFNYECTDNKPNYHE